jgi:hypothetical protein
MSYEKAEHTDNPVAEDEVQPPSDTEQEAIDEERRRRLDPANRPDGSEVDNTNATLPTLEAWEAEQDSDDVIGTSDPSKVFRETEVSDEERAAIAEERERRLDPANRPEGAEVDNTDRKVVDGRFVDDD